MKFITSEDNGFVDLDILFVLYDNLTTIWSSKEKEKMLNVKNQFKKKKIKSNEL
jgi:hypothetical protein